MKLTGEDKAYLRQLMKDYLKKNPDATPVYSYYYSGTFPGGSGTIDLPETFNASWVRITNGVQKALNISEVQIYTPTDNEGFSAASWAYKKDVALLQFDVVSRRFACLALIF